jgi:hypothetical protein
MEIESRSGIKFFTDEGILRVEIVCRLKKHYGDHILSRTQVYFWINEIKRDRTDLSTIASPGREPDEGLASFIAGKLGPDPHLPARTVAHPMGIATSTACRCRSEVLGMKCRHLRWVPHTLTAGQKLMRAELAQSTLQALVKRQYTNFHFLFTGDETWTFSAHDDRTM